MGQLESRRIMEGKPQRAVRAPEVPLWQVGRRGSKKVYRVDLRTEQDARDQPAAIV